MTDDKHRERMDPAKRLAELRAGGNDKTAAEAEELVADEIIEERQSFSILSADRQHKLMVELRFKTGNARAFAYSYLVSIEFNPSQGIRMDFSGYEVKIAGRNLNPLFAGLVAQRVATVTEVDDLHAEATLAKSATVVAAIEVAESR